MVKTCIALIWAATMAGYFWNDPVYFTYINIIHKWKIDGSGEAMRYHCTDCKRYDEEDIPWNELKPIMEAHTYDQYSAEAERPQTVIYGVKMHKRVYSRIPDYAYPTERGFKNWFDGSRLNVF